MKIITEKGIFQKKGCCPKSSNHCGNIFMERSPINTLASPRKPISIANVTTKDGSFTTVIQNPLNAPPTAPIVIEAIRAIVIGIPDSTNQPKAHAERPIIDATDKSISALIIIFAIINAIITFSIDKTKRLI